MPDHADAPFPLIETPIHAQKGLPDAQKTPHSYAQGASIMTLVHNVIIRGLNSIYLQAPHVSKQDRADFISYATCWYEFTSNHFRNEAESIIPTVEAKCGEKGVLDQDLKEHEVFADGFNEYKNYLATVASTPADFDGKKLVSVIDSFAPEMMKHLRKQIPRMLELARFGDKIPMLEIIETEGNRSTQNLSKAGGMIFFLRNLDLGYEDGLWKDWPPIPSAARWGVLKTLGKFHSRWWVYAACDEPGRLQKLHAVAV
ncbi:hypothetical protein DM02DRAFT_612477 [Periconia macrospinosa]|uniref:Hemerythrin-like domain-containing protein n=1 Tax=Periconia macrospinosa TaxID=97972 RepID=A0A2V1E0F4_9PLEO|nr:hypothetical protein DM02DRAFT_612477 [Periconia macrospinosa]